MVSDERLIRTIKGGRVTFLRGNEIIDLGGDTQIQIRDKSGRKFTTVQQYFVASPSKPMRGRSNIPR